MLGAILDQTAIAIDRARLSKESLEQAAKLEGERFRSALLSSISHDLKTPLATITGAVSSLRELGDKMTPESRDDLLASIEEEERPAGALRRQPARHDQDRGRHGGCEARLGRCRRRHPRCRCSAPPDISRAATIETSIGDGPAADPRRQRASGAGAVQPDRQCGQIWRQRADQHLCPDRRQTTSSFPSPISARAFRRRIWRTSSKNSSGAASRTAELPEPGLGLAIAKGFVEAMGGTIERRKPGREAARHAHHLALPGSTGDDSPPESR